MYTDFYNLKEKPFNLSPSSRFLYLGDAHKEALALLTYGLTERQGFVLLTGEVGTGKTTMVHTLLANLDKDVQSAYISNPSGPTLDFMNYLAATTFDKKADFRSKMEFLRAFEEFLRQCSQNRKRLLLIVDEAHKLSYQLLEEIRLLSNLETAEEKLLTIFLIGQPELIDKLSRPRCRALRQRISLRYHIQPLDQESTSEYITTRLKTAGAEDGYKIFSHKVINAVYRFAEGYPRLINILADNALLLGYARGTDRITPAMIRECYEDWLLDDKTLETTFTKRKSRRSRRAEYFQAKHYWKWAAVLLLIVATATFALSHHGEQVFSQLRTFVERKSLNILD